MTSQSSLEARVAHVEGIVGQIDSRLMRIEARLDESVTELRSEIRGSVTELRSEIRGSVTELRKDVSSLDERTQKYFLWTVGIVLSVLLPMWVSVMLAVLLGT